MVKMLDYQSIRSLYHYVHSSFCQDGHWQMWREEKVLDVNANVYSNLQLYLANKFIYNKAAPSNIKFIKNLSQDNYFNLEKKTNKSSGDRRQIPIDGAGVCFGSELEIIYGN